jgi:phage-related holin
MHNTPISPMNNFNVKNMTGAKVLGWTLISWIWSLVLPLAPFVGITVILVVFDMLTGIAAAYHRKEPITSKAMRRTIMKITLYLIGILASEAVHKVFLMKLGSHGPINITFVVSGLVAATEFKSLMENIRTVTGVNFLNKIIEALPDVWKFLNNNKGDKPDS